MSRQNKILFLISIYFVLGLLITCIFSSYTNIFFGITTLVMAIMFFSLLIREQYIKWSPYFPSIQKYINHISTKQSVAPLFRCQRAKRFNCCDLFSLTLYMVLLSDTFLKYGLMERVMSVFPYAYIIILLWMIYYLDRFAIYCMNTAKETDHYLVMSLLLWGCVSLSIASLINITNTSLSLLIMSIVAGFILLYRTCYGIISGKTSPLVRLTCACVFSILIVIYAAFNLAQYEISMNPPSTSDPNALNDIILIETINKVHELTTLNQSNNMIQNNTINWLHVVEKILTVYGAAIILYMNGLAIKDNDIEKDIRK